MQTYIKHILITCLLCCYADIALAKDAYAIIFKNADINKSIEILKQGKNNHVEELWLEAIQQAEKVHRNYEDDRYPELCFWIGKTIQTTGDYKTAYYYLYKTLTLEKDQQKTYIAEFDQAIGHTYYNFMRYKLAEKHLLKSLNNPNTLENDKISLYNTLGLIYRNRKDNIKSESYFRKAYNLAEKENHKPWLSVLSGNLGFITLRNGKMQEARELITFDYETGIEQKQYNSAYNALASLITIDLKEKKLTDAKEKLAILDSALQVIGDLGLKLEYYRALIEYQTIIGDYESAYNNTKSLSILKDTLSLQKNDLQLYNIESQISIEKKEAENYTLNERKEKDKLKIISLISICIILLIAAIIVVYQISKRRIREREIQELQKSKIQEELRVAEIELKALLQTSINKSKIIEELQGDLEEGQQKESDPQKTELIEKLQDFSLLTDDDWISFKNLFEKLNPNFFIYFRTKHPEVTVAEIRLAALIKLNLTTNEMAQTLGISPDSVRKTSLRLRKKIGIESNDELFQFIYNIA